MTEKPNPLKPQKPPRSAKERAEWGRMKPVTYPDRPDKRLGNWLLGLLTPWKR